MTVEDCLYMFFFFKINQGITLDFWMRPFAYVMQRRLDCDKLSDLSTTKSLKSEAVEELLLEACQLELVN